MGVRTGYKTTEVGVIPDEWEVFDLASLGKGQIPPIKAGPFGSSLTKDTYVATGYKVYGQEQVIRGDYLYGDYFITQKKYQELESCAVRPGDVLLSLVGTVGRLLAIPDNAPPGIINPRLIRFSFDKSRVCSSFFQYLFESGHVQMLLERRAQGGTMGVLNAAALRSFRIQLPPLHEQSAIATALSDVDALLGALDRLIAKKRDLKQAAMQQLLTGQTRLAGFHSDWEVKQLGEIGVCIRGVSYRGDSDLSAYDTACTKRLLRSNNVQHATVVNSDLQFVNAIRVSDSQVLRENDVLICMANGSKALVGKAGLFKIDDEYEYTFGAFMGCFRCDPAKSSPTFAFYLFQTGGYRNHINNLLAGSSINNLRPSSIESLEFRMPPPAEQIAIAEVLSDMDAEISVLEQRRTKTLALKQGMLQELLTGRTRLV